MINKSKYVFKEEEEIGCVAFQTETKVTRSWNVVEDGMTSVPFRSPLEPHINF